MPAVHTHHLECDPNSYDPQSGGVESGNHYSYCFPTWTSPNQTVVGGNPGTIRWDTGPYAVSGKVYAAFLFRVLPGGQQPGRIVNFHNHPTLGGWYDEPHPANGVSAVALDWNNGSVKDGKNGLLLSLEAHSGSAAWAVLTDAQMRARQAAGQWISLVMEVTIGRPGRVRIWLDGADVPVVDTGPANTYWTGGFGYTDQTGYLMYGPGMYNSSGVSSTTIVESTPGRYGSTPEAMVQDGVAWAITEYAVNGSYSRSNPSQPAFRHTVITSKTTDDYLIPASLGGGGGGGGGGGPEPPPPDPTAPNPTLWFGSKTLGDAASLTLDNKRASAFLCGQAMDVTSLWAELQGIESWDIPTTPVAQVKGVIYAMSGDPSTGGVPTTLLGTTNAVTVSGGEAAVWKQLTFGSPITVQAGTWYALGLITGGDNATAVTRILEGSGTFFANSDSYADGASNPFGTPASTTARTMPILAEGSVAAATAQRRTAEGRTGTGTRVAGGSGRRAGEGGGMG